MDSIVTQSSIVAFIDDNDNLNTIQRMFDELDLQHTVARQGNITDAVFYLIENRSPRVLIIDISTSELPMSDMYKLADVCEPSTFVIAVGTKNDVSLFRDITKLGVTDYIVKPLPKELLTRLVQNLLTGKAESYSEHKTGKVIAFLGARGGVGTTSIATNFAWIMALEKFKRVLLWDFDIQYGDIPLMLDSKHIMNLKDVLCVPERIDENFIHQGMVNYNDRLSLLAGHESLDSPISYPSRSIETIVPMITSNFHYLIVDLPRSIDIASHTLLQYASNIFIVTEPSVAGARETARIMDLDICKNKKNKMCIVLNNIGKYQKGEIKIADFQMSINTEIFGAIPFDRENGLVASNIGETLISLKSIAALEIRKMAHKISGTLITSPKPDSNSIIAKIKSKLFGDKR